MSVAAVNEKPINETEQAKTDQAHHNFTQHAVNEQNQKASDNQNSSSSQPALASRSLFGDNFTDRRVMDLMPYDNTPSLYEAVDNEGPGEEMSEGSEDMARTMALLSYQVGRNGLMGAYRWEMGNSVFNSTSAKYIENPNNNIFHDPIAGNVKPDDFYRQGTANSALRKIYNAPETNASDLRKNASSHLRNASFLSSTAQAASFGLAGSNLIANWEAMNASDRTIAGGDVASSAAVLSKDYLFAAGASTLRNSGNEMSAISKLQWGHTLNMVGNGANIGVNALRIANELQSDNPDASTIAAATTESGISGALMGLSGHFKNSARVASEVNDKIDALKFAGLAYPKALSIGLKVSTGAGAVLGSVQNIANLHNTIRDDSLTGAEKRDRYISAGIGLLGCAALGASAFCLAPGALAVGYGLTAIGTGALVTQAVWDNRQALGELVTKVPGKMTDMWQATYHFTGFEKG
jgi:hypothetical protein